MVSSARGARGAVQAGLDEGGEGVAVGAGGDLEGVGEGFWVALDFVRDEFREEREGVVGDFQAGLAVGVSVGVEQAEGGEG